MRALAALVFLLVVLAACGGEEAADDAAGDSAQTIEIVGTEFALEPATVELDAPGTYTFRFRNEGSTTHALEVEGHGVEDETEEIEGGETAELTVELGEAGEYELYCPVGGHKDQGMEGMVVVGGSAGAGTTEPATTDETTTEEQGEDSGYGYD